MNDCLQFKAWDKINKKWLPVTGLHYLYAGKLSGISYDSEEGEQQDMPLENIEIVRCPGLKDDNGKPIFYGDIVDVAFHDGDDRKGDWWGTALVITSMNGGLGLLSDYGDSWDGEVFAVDQGGFVEDYWPDNDLWEIEIIGNMYENPELLDRSHCKPPYKQEVPEKILKF